MQKESWTTAWATGHVKRLLIGIGFIKEGGF